MTIRRLTPGQARAVGRALARAAELFAQFVRAVREIGRRLLTAVDEARWLARQVQTVLVRADRPAWASPYGPPAPATPRLNTQQGRALCPGRPGRAPQVEITIRPEHHRSTR
ncbi:hypothetical protein DMB38_12905 [Streptomyces sp. WAC 06738]|uniref:hypothetical protein n=1 Tax=Streptomyces sp. WAC 06738 TaxID=2203210 RepID=UPI000F6EBCE8|nr:hypothetical protein [Streptomyces sp. WAC 06738]AZM46593.1 hypothetical protein DMB38_12905 [Streptomyces sp. WAC 06738]